ncbi:MAG: Wzz/FepE/Etk N-terminal domain-containing protein [Nocardioides sp.]|uniref:Wzz/FepE/Etk N-terminal domain-containing protein n=1 Tax=Nocardioides sp. TaxID=35761 RepID=UPI0039E560B8
MSDQYEAEPSLELGRYWAVVKRRWVLVVALALLGAVAAGLYAVVTPKSYTATTLVNINVIAVEPFDNQKPDSELIDAVTEEQLARSSTVMRSAGETLGGGTSIADVRHAMTVTVLSGATVARVTFTASSMDRAIKGSDAVGQAYVNYRTQRAQDRVDRIVSKLNKQKAALSKRLTAVNTTLDKGGLTTAQRAAASSQRQVLQSQISSLLAQLSSATSIDTSGGYVITQAADTALSVKPHTQLLVEIGAALGLVLGLLAAFVVDALDRRVISAADVSKYHGGRLLSRLFDDRAAVPADGSDAEPYRLAAEQLLALGPSGRSSFTVVDLTRRPQPFVAANLALALSTSSDDTVIGVFPDGAEETRETLVDECGARAVDTPLAGFDGSAVSLGDSAQEERAGTVIVALPPGSARSQVLAAVRQATSVILVLERRHTHRREMDTLVEAMSAVGGTVVGSLLAPTVTRSERRGARVSASEERPTPVPAREGV